MDLARVRKVIVAMNALKCHLETSELAHGASEEQRAALKALPFKANTPVHVKFLMLQNIHS